MFKIINKLMVIGLSGFILTGCDGQIEDLRVFVAEAKNQPQQPIKPLPAIPEYNPIPYDGISLADPFFPRRLIVDGVGGVKDKTPPPDSNRPKEFLENIALDQIKMIGFFFNSQKKPVALMQTPDKKVYMVGVGQYMGMNYGRVKSLKDDQVVLVEQVYDTGQWQPRELKIEIVSK